MFCQSGPHPNGSPRSGPSRLEGLAHRSGVIAVPNQNRQSPTRVNLRLRGRVRLGKPENPKQLRFLASPLVIFGVSFGRGRVYVNTSSHRRPKALPQYMWLLQPWQPFDCMPWFKWTAVPMCWFWLFGFLKSCAEKQQIAFGGKKSLAYVEPGGSSCMHSHAYDSMPPLPGHRDDELVRGDLLASWHRPHHLVCSVSWRLLQAWAIVMQMIAHGVLGKTVL